jgi:nicotinate-nucleotide pyrophosphorylase (carboxylating)
MSIKEWVLSALQEDIQSGDITTETLLPTPLSAKAVMQAKASGVFFGHVVLNTIPEIYPDITLTHVKPDGAALAPHDICCHLSGSIQSILALERTLLNIIQHLSGVATLTQAYVRALNDPRIHILDTRKTTPLMRGLEKQAVVCGGGYNHRHGLYDMMLIKENHLRPYITTYGIPALNDQLIAFKAANPHIGVEIEVQSPDLIDELHLPAIDVIMCDNMTHAAIHQSIDRINRLAPHILKEVSGNIRLDTIAAYRGMAIDRISVGALTHSANALDISLLIT